MILTKLAWMVDVFCDYDDVDDDVDVDVDVVNDFEYVEDGDDVDVDDGVSHDVANHLIELDSQILLLLCRL